MNRDSRDDEECVELERIFGIILGVDVVKWVKIRDGNFGWVRILIDSLRIAALDEVILF